MIDFSPNSVKTMEERERGENIIPHPSRQRFACTLLGWWHYRKVEKLNLKVINLVLMTNISMVNFPYADICFLP